MTIRTCPCTYVKVFLILLILNERSDILFIGYLLDIYGCMID